MFWYVSIVGTIWLLLNAYSDTLLRFVHYIYCSKAVWVLRCSLCVRKKLCKWWYSDIATEPPAPSLSDYSYCLSVKPVVANLKPQGKNLSAVYRNTSYLDRTFRRLVEVHAAQHPVKYSQVAIYRYLIVTEPSTGAKNVCVSLIVFTDINDFRTWTGFPVSVCAIKVNHSYTFRLVS